ESRSIAEMLLHTAGAGFGFPKMLDVAAPAGFDGKGFDKTTTDKAKIIEWLNKSFAHSISAANGMAHADYAKLVPKLGPGANQGDSRVDGEHLQAFTNQWKMKVVRHDGSVLEDAGSWTDELSATTIEGRRCWKRSQAATFKRKTGEVAATTSTVNIFDAKTTA